MTPKNKRTVRRFLLAEYLGNGKVRFTCRTCGHKHTKIYPNSGPKGVSHWFLEHKLIRYWNSTGGAIGSCKWCVKNDTRRH